MDDKLAILWQRFRPTILARVDVVEAATTALRDGTRNEASRNIAVDNAHKLAGSLGTFGLPRGSEVASELEHLFQMEEPPLERVLELTAELRKILQMPLQIP
jgi:HPt (histidine-containing phosphotransfer) domain-containing protein